jgi:hypothetical protein
MRDTKAVERFLCMAHERSEEMQIHLDALLHSDSAIPGREADYTRALELLSQSASETSALICRAALSNATGIGGGR